MDIATKENMVKLGEIGEKLLNKPASWVNLRTGLSEPRNNGQTNAESLIRLVDFFTLSVI